MMMMTDGQWQQSVRHGESVFVEVVMVVVVITTMTMMMDVKNLSKTATSLVFLRW